VGAVSAVNGSPFFLVKARLQNMGSPNAKAQYNYTGMVDGLKQVYSAEGVAGLFRGFEGGVMRVMVGSAAQLSSYESCKRLIKKHGGFEDGAALHLASALGSGLVVTTAMNPFDVVSTRLYTQQVGENANYRSGWRGPVDCITKIAKVEGLMGFYKGWSAHYMRLGPHTVFTFMFLEQAKKFATEIGY